MVDILRKRASQRKRTQKTTTPSPRAPSLYPSLSFSSQTGNVIGTLLNNSRLVGNVDDSNEMRMTVGDARVTCEKFSSSSSQTKFLHGIFIFFKVFFSCYFILHSPARVFGYVCFLCVILITFASFFLCVELLISFTFTINSAYTHKFVFGARGANICNIL